MQWVAQEGEYPVIQPVFNVSDMQFTICVCGQATAELLARFVSCCFQENCSGGPPGTGEHTQPVTSGDGW